MTKLIATIESADALTADEAKLAELQQRRDALLRELSDVRHTIEVTQARVAARRRRRGRGDPILSVRAQNALRNARIDDLSPAAVARLTDADLLCLSNVGRRTLAEIEGWLADHGLALAGEEDP